MKVSKDKIIFIHIPKTGGTTVNTAMQGTFWQTTPDFNYRHIDGKTMISNSGDIFRSSSIEKYKDFKIFTMFRDPVDRILSEYSFIKERRDFMNLLKPQPKSFEEYVMNSQTSNGVLKFLLGNRMYSPVKLTEDDLQRAIGVIHEIPIHIGIFEEFGKSLSYFSAVTGIDWGKKIEVKRITFKRPRIKDISDEIKQIIAEKNQLDIKLYQVGKELFEKEASGVKSNIKFLSDKYNHAIPYAYNFCFFEYCLENKMFINQNLAFFKTMTHYLIKEEKLNDGRAFTKSWIHSFMRHFQQQYGNTHTYKEVQKIMDQKLEPLDLLEKVAERLDHLFKNEGKPELNRIKLKFERALIQVHKPRLSDRLGKLFG
jgi:hypothetical protein